jgi:hypothetical protein
MYHRALRFYATSAVALHGLGILDFNKSGYFRMSERYMQERKHADANRSASQ